MNVAESSFKELMGDIGGFSRDHVRTAIIETLKNITQQSFGGINIFESPLVDKNIRTKYKHEFIKNNLSQEEYSNKIKHKVRYHSFLSGLVIPLRTPKWSVGSRSRLVISCDNYLVNIQISIQFYVDNVDKWVSVPCRTNTVKETIMNLFPQE